jgi:uncharacterized protein RhaS with RHS repeats
LEWRVRSREESRDITTLPGGNTVRSDYSGTTVTATDQVNRKIKRESDGFGRLIKVTEQDVSTGALTQETSYTYNLVDKLTQVNQGNQTRSFSYDTQHGNSRALPVPNGSTKIISDAPRKHGCGGD